MSAPEEPEEPDELNGLLLKSHYIPEEVLALILSFVDVNSLVFSCRRVCKLWKYLIDEDVWKIRLRTSKEHSLSKLSRTERISLKFPWYVYYSIFSADPYEKNLIKNHCGQEKMKYWLSGPKGHTPQIGNGYWQTETEPQGSDPVPKHEDFDDCTSCFVTSYEESEKYQIINLRSSRIINNIMDEYQPTITASEWYAGRFDCGCKYLLTVSLLDKDKNVLCEKKTPLQMVKQWEGRAWKKVELTFDNYGPNVKFVEFKHEGKDTQYWSGHYGSKMSGAVVKISLPKPKRTDSE